MTPRPELPHVTDAEAEAGIAACPPWSSDILRSIREATVALSAGNARLDAEILRLARQQRGDSHLQ